MTLFGLVRHGITSWNAEGRAQGQMDIPLNETGKQQARALANRIHKESWDYVYTSDLKRAEETARIINERLRIPIQLDPRLREITLGQLDGSTEVERIEKWGSNWRELDLGKEKEPEVLQRIDSFMEYIQSQHTNQKILVISHGAFIAVMLKKLVPHMEFQNSLRNTSISLLERQQDQWKCDLYNCIRHLDLI